MTISGDYLFIGLLMLGLTLTMLASKRYNILLSFCAALTWFSIGMWLWFASVPIFGLTENWSKVLIWVFFILAFVPFLLGMDTEIKHTMKDGTSWVDIGDKPTMAKPPTDYESYRVELKRRMGRLK